MKNKIFLLLISLLLAFGLASCDKSGDGKDNENSGENNNENSKNESGGSNYDDGGAFDYLTADLSKYITINAHKEYTLNLNIAKPKAVDTDVEILKLLCAKKGAVLNDGEEVTSGRITPGDVVNIFYRGYVVGDNGEEIATDNMCNFSGSASPLEIGSGRFVSGFEFNLSGKEFTTANQFVKITSGNVSQEQIVYISYTRQLSDGSDKITKSAERVVLSDGKEKIDAKYGDGFYDRLLTLTVGATEGVDFDVTVSEKKYNYTSLKINFATTCEKPGNYFLVDCYFSYDYGTESLRNKNARFEVYIQSAKEYEEAKLTDGFIENNLSHFGITLSDLEKFEGDRVSQLRQFIKKALDDRYESTYNSKLEEAMWNHYHSESVTKVIMYPKAIVDPIYNEYYNDVLYQFEQSGGVVNGAYGMSFTCETLDQYAIYYLGLQYSEIQDWKAYLRGMAESLVKERLILFYIMRAENLLPTPDALAAKVAELKNEYLLDYVSQYCDAYKIDKSTYSESDWAKFLSDREKELLEYYDDAYFEEISYYNIARTPMLSWPTVVTLDK